MTTFINKVACATAISFALFASTQASAGNNNSLPAVDSLTASSDYAVFMQKGVPESLRLQALRKLWNAHPIISSQDGLTDYGSDSGSETSRELDAQAVILGTANRKSSALPNNRESNGQLDVQAAILGTADRTAAVTGDIKPGALPNIRELNQDSDFAAFMRPNVPEALRLDAMAKLWRVHPIISQVDELSDYGDDYRDQSIKGPVLAER